MAKRKSLRKYPERMCANTLSCSKGNFIPHDKRQQYCCVQCRTNANNDNRALLNKTTFQKEKFLRLYDRKLSKIFQKYGDEKLYCFVKREILSYEEIDVRLLVEDGPGVLTNTKTRWFYEFGTEVHPTDERYFIIHKRGGQ
jgi:hypothetical protein